MASISSTRPTRRAATRRRALVESSEEETDDRNAIANIKEDEEEDEFTPVPKSSPQRKPRRTTTGTLPSTPKRRTMRTKAGIHENIEPSQIFDPESSVSQGPPSPTKKSSPRKRNPPALVHKGDFSIPEISPPLPTPENSASPEPSELHGTPLADITNARVNERSRALPTQQDSTQILSSSRVPVPIKPMDIVVRSRSTAIPPTPEHAGPTSRIVIRYLVLTNFKSYAGRQEVGPFHTSFSSVVGPNGSGKSNVIDSLLFVFGFRASKMRQGKISALIHNSAACPNLDHCEVEVHFQEVMDLPEGGHKVIPDSDMIVSRKAFKNNASKYYINAKESSFTIVTTMLKERGIDLDHKRFLILQGEVESIAQMKPKAANEHDDGLLEYLEDIIGTSKYKAPIEESATEVETLNEVCMEKSTRVQHVEKERNSLEDKKNKALAYIKDENELAAKQSALYQIYIDECGDNIEITEQAVTQMQEQLNAELERHRGNEKGIRELEKTYKRCAQEYGNLEEETKAIVKEMTKYDKENVKFEEKRKFLANKQKKLEKTLQTATLAMSEAASLIERYSGDAERNVERSVEVEKALEGETRELGTIRDSLKGKTQGISDEIARKQKSLAPWNAKINERQSAIAVAQSELDMLHEKSNAGAVALEEITTRIQEIAERRGNKEGDLDELRSKKGSITKLAAKLQIELDKLAKKEPELRAQISGARQKADEAHASLSSRQTQGNVLSGLMRLKESGRIDGFHGRLGNLGAIDEKYDVAISTACPALDNIVVDSVEVGQQCIDYLRKNNLGRANFILLDRLARRDLSVIPTPENVPRLYDLIRSKEEKFKPAFYSVLQNTVVAKDLSHANRIAYGAQRWRVVTLDGQLIDKSGTMSGGGTRVAKGGMSSKVVADVSREQVSKLEVDRDGLEKAFEEFQNRQRELEGELKDLQRQLPTLETEMQKIDLEFESSSRNLADAQRRVKELDSEHRPSKADDIRKSALEKQITGLEKQVAQLHSETADLEEEIKNLQDKIMEVGGVKLRSQKAKVDGLKEQIDSLNEDTSAVEVSKVKAEKQLTKQQKAQRDAEKELASVAEQLEKLSGEFEVQTEVSAASKKQVEEAQESLDSRKENLVSLKTELDEKTAELNEIRGAEIEMRNKLEQNQKVLAENQKRSRYWSEKLTKLSIQKIDDIDTPTDCSQEALAVKGDQSQVEGPDNDISQSTSTDSNASLLPSTSDLPTYTKDELSGMSKSKLKSEIAVLEERISSTTIELSVLSEYRRRVEEHRARSLDLDGAVLSRNMIKARLDSLRQSRLEGFMEGFSIISLRLKEMYQMITMGGNAELELVDSLDPFSEGILFSVMPPKKSWKNISNLSGGEKTLSSLALVFALHHYKPTPLYVMDEIDAALDFRNVSIVASYIKERTKNAQFIVISLRNNMFELASRLVGVYKVNHMTKSITIENRDYITGRV